MELFISNFMQTIASHLQTMSVFQVTAAVIWLVMVFSFFAWIFYLVVTK